GEKIRSRQAEIVSPEPQNPEEVPWPTGDLLSEEKPPGVDMLGLEEALDWAFSEPDPERLRRTRAVVVVYNGQIIAERYASGITKDTPLIGWSMTKSVINALVGILVGQGKIALQAPAPVPEWQDPDDPRHAITVDHLLRMSSGLRFIEEYEENPTSDVDIMLFTKPDTAAFAASFPLEAEPDTRWHYSSGTSNILSRIIRQCFPDDTAYWAFPRKALFNRIGMRTAVFETDASGTFVGASFLYASARDWARFGLLYLNEGVWEGERILPEGWVEYTTTPTPTNTRGSYGAHFWLNRGNRDNPEDRPFPRLPRDLFSCEGYQGQFVMILPSRNLVVVRLGMTTHGGWNMEEFMLKTLDALPEPH
ncbi:MAG: serine hydrolase domain-containing protein, partial [Candidatus Aminicenantales bacterium]